MDEPIKLDVIGTGAPSTPRGELHIKNAHDVLRIVHFALNEGDRILKVVIPFTLLNDKFGVSVGNDSED